MKFLKKILPEPPNKWPNKEPEKILLEDCHWHYTQVESLRGRIKCFIIAFDKLEHTIWKELTK